jgi:putative ABC transport system permease protein
MNTREAIRIALHSLWANKLRSILTLLGVVIGVSAVIAVVTFVSGINGYVANRIFRLGADVFIAGKISPVVTNIDQYLEGQRRKDFNMEDYEAVLQSCRTCRYVGAFLSNSNGHVRYSDQSSTDTSVRGITASMGPIMDFDLTAGRMINQSDVGNDAKVVVIGTDILENLMPNVDPIGKELRVDGQLYTIIGLGEKQGKTLGQSQDNYVIMPISTYQHVYGARNSIRIYGKAQGVTGLQRSMDEVRAILRSRRHDLPGSADSFTIENNASFLGIWSNLSGSFFIAMIAIAAISLIVGGIVIMNIMLVSVTERTREIGIRKALGARRSDVLRQFLIESSTMAIVGGVLGIVLGVTVAKLITTLVGMPSSIKLWAVLAGLAVSASVGIFFGVYPARKAAALDPIQALRFEL